MRYDAVVIGAGPAGWSAALQGSKLGLHVAIVERAALVGGASVHTGTITSKTLRQAILDVAAVRRGGELGLHTSHARPVSMQDLMRRKDAVIQSQVHTLESFLDRNRIHVVRGSAAVASPHALRVATPDGEQRLEADRFFVAVGSRPRRPDSIPFDDRVVCDSDSILSLDAVPRSLTVLGGGVIGCEYACMFAALGVKVTLIDRRDRLLRFLDGAILDAFHHELRIRGVRLLLREEVESVTVERDRRGASTRVTLASGRAVRGERLLAAAGRESNTFALNLDAAGIETDATGLVKVDEHYRTAQPHIYAVGDVVGFPALAGTSAHQGRVAMLHACGRPAPPLGDLPIAVYTIPEISMVGMTEEACRDAGVAYEVGTARFCEIPRGLISGSLDGELKLVFRREDRVLLGVHVLGVGASELIHLGMAIVHAGGTIDELADSVFNHPTLTEAYRVAALDGLNRL